MANRPKHRPYSAMSVILFALMIALLIAALSLLPPDALSKLLSSLFRGQGNELLSPEQLAYETIFDDMALPETAAPTPLDAPSLTEAFAHFAFAGKYLQLYTVTYTDGTSTIVRTVSLNRANDRYAAVIYDGETQDSASRLQTIRGSSSEIVIEDANGNKQSYPASSDFTLASAVLQPDPDALCARLAAHEADPAASPYETCTAELADSAHGRVLTLVAVERGTRLTQTYTYLLDYGILYSARSAQGELVYYTFETQSFSMGDEANDE